MASKTNFDSSNSKGIKQSEDEQRLKEKESLIEEIKAKMKSNANQFFPSWVLNWASFQKDAETIYTVLSNKFKETMKLIEQQIEEELKYNVLDCIFRKLSQVYTAVYLKKLNVEQLLAKSNNLIEFCSKDGKSYLDKKYIPGIMYCLNGLEATYRLELPLQYSSLEKLQTLNANLIVFNELSVSGQITVLAMQQSFLGHVHRQSYKEQESILRKLIEMDPTNGIWYLRLHQVKRYERRSHFRFFYPPTKQEISLIATASKLSPKNPRMLIALFSVLAEIVRKNANSKCTQTIDFGTGIVFKSAMEAVVYLNYEARKVLIWDPLSVRINASVAEIFSTILPIEFRDYALAHTCIERALLVHPNSSKANGRKAIFLLTVKNNPELAIKYFGKSLESDPRNFPSLWDLLLIYMKDFASNGPNIERILQREMRNHEWTESHLSRLYFINGLYCFVNLDFRNAVENWIISADISPNYEASFKNFSSFKRKYGWTHELLTLEVMHRNTIRQRSNFSGRKTWALNEILRVMEIGLKRERGFARIDNPANGFIGFGDNGIPSWKSNFPSQEHFDEPETEDSAKIPENVLHIAKEGDHSNALKYTGKIYRKSFQTLGLPDGSTKEEVKMQYRKLCLELHPDKNCGTIGAELEALLERMKEVNVAYEDLTCKFEDD